jgi:dephospho-CoA kinase
MQCSGLSYQYLDYYIIIGVLVSCRGTIWSWHRSGNRKMKVIGLTGGIGSGKSTVAQFMAELGAVVLELDKVGHEVMKSGTDVWRQLVDEFGEDIIAADGEIDRSRLGKIVFNESNALERLNNIIHPEIDKIIAVKLDEYRRRGIDYVVLEAAARLDTDRSSQVDEIWTTVAPDNVVLKRLASRSGFSEKETRARIRAQLPDEERIKRADVVIDTDCSLDELRDRVVKAWKKMQARNAG